MLLNSLCLIDADVTIDGFKYQYFHALVTGHAIGMSGYVCTQEVQYYKDANGCHVAIDLTSYVTTGAVQVEGATALEMQEFYSVYPGRGLGRGEQESIALVMARGYFFCTADHSAMKAMRNLGLQSQRIALEDLLDALTPPIPIPDPKYARTIQP